MKHINQLLLWGLCLTLTPAHTLLAQMGLNAPRGLAPRQDLEIYTRNGFLVQQKFSFTIADPNASVHTLSCASPAPILGSHAGIMKDPGGDNNYAANTDCIQQIQYNGSVSGYEVVFEDLDTETADDRVIIYDAAGNALTFSGNALPAPFFVPGFQLFIGFSSDGDGIVGRGFRLRWREVYVDTSSPATPDIAFGNAIQFDTKKGVLLSGNLAMGALSRAGLYSTALGHTNTASGQQASALGRGNVASGITSVALGGGNTASGIVASAQGLNNTVGGDYASALGRDNTVGGDYSSAVGFSNVVAGNSASAFGSANVASGYLSTALGSENTTSANFSSALGYRNTAKGVFSTAIGSGVSTGTGAGAMALGDHETTVSVINGTAGYLNNQFTARFRGGFRFITAYNDATGNLTAALLEPGENSWSSISDSTKKENFRPLNYAGVLLKLSSLRLGSWNYKGQPDKRHYGPMAQDFYARFGHDGLGTIGCDTLLASHDFTAVTLAGVQGLIHENEQLKAQLAAVEARLRAIEAMLTGRRRTVAVR